MTSTGRRYEHSLLSYRKFYEYKIMRNKLDFDEIENWDDTDFDYPFHIFEEKFSYSNLRISNIYT